MQTLQTIACDLTAPANRSRGKENSVRHVQIARLQSAGSSEPQLAVPC